MEYVTQLKSHHWQMRKFLKLHFMILGFQQNMGERKFQEN